MYIGNLVEYNGRTPPRETPGKTSWCSEQTDLEPSVHCLHIVHDKECNVLDAIRGRIGLQQDVRESNVLSMTETWLTPLMLGQVIQPVVSVFQTNRRVESGKSRAGAVCFVPNNNNND